MSSKFKKKPQPNRSYEELYNHYLVEKTIAEKLNNSTKEERKKIYPNMYDELFRKVPNHPRLKRSRDAELSKNAIHNNFSLIKRYLTKSKIVAEFGSGDCKFLYSISEYCKYVYGIDISDQRDPSDKPPKNFKLIIYDGFEINEINKNSIDIIISDQLIEHLHPDDSEHHFSLVYTLLKNNGKYIIRTPHSITGPHDISKYFSNTPQGFHLKEWSYTEIIQSLKSSGYQKFKGYWSAKNTHLRLPLFYFTFLEKFHKTVISLILPKLVIKKIYKYLIPTVCVIGIK